MKKYLVFIALLATNLLHASLKVEGVYEFPKKTTHLQIYKNGDAYEGKITWVKENKKDEKNPNPTLRNREIQNLVILKNLKQTGDNLYSEGEAYDPESGNTYRCKIWFEEGNEQKLHVRGYIGIPLLGRSSELTRIE